MFSDIYQSGERDWFLKEVQQIIFQELSVMYRTSFISPWWRKMFKSALEKYVAKLVNSYQQAFPRVNIQEMINPTDSLLTKKEWEVYLNTQAEKLASLVLRAEDALEAVNEGYMFALTNSWRQENSSVFNA
jgi:murein L,D-transpeptidase YafK